MVKDFFCLSALLLRFAEDIEDYTCYLDNILKGTKYRYILDGSYYTDDEPISYYVVVDGVRDEIAKGSGFSFLDSVSEELEKFLTEKGFEFSKPNIVWAELWH